MGGREEHSFAMPNEWSDRPYSVVWSYDKVCFALFESTRSMHDPVFPFVNVLHAGGPGWAPFKMCHPCISHSAISQGARQLV